jgi:uncharacterized protein (UPF0147 family)
MAAAHATSSVLSEFVQSACATSHAAKTAEVAIHEVNGRIHTAVEELKAFLHDPAVPASVKRLAHRADIATLEHVSAALKSAKATAAVHEASPKSIWRVTVHVTTHGEGKAAHDESFEVIVPGN